MAYQNLPGVFIYSPPVKAHKVFRRLALYPIQRILNRVSRKTNIKFKSFMGYRLNMAKQRYKVFYDKGTFCVKCGLQGSYFALERALFNGEESVPHFSLYGIDEQGDEVLITVDHLIPLSLGGKNTQDNKVPMCVKCNREKGNKLEDISLYVGQIRQNQAFLPNFRRKDEF